MSRGFHVRPEPTDEERKEALRLSRMGYRRVSWAYRMVKRIDREDWVEVLAKYTNRAPADFYVIGEYAPSESWAGFYRRVLSKDCIEVSEGMIGLFRTT